MNSRNITHFVISWIFGILGVILLLFLVNFLSLFVQSIFVEDLVSFFNANLILLILISFLFFLGSLFFHFGFPVNILSPIFDAFGGGFLVSFLIGLVLVINKYIPVGIGDFLRKYSFTISVIVFFIILILGFMSVLQDYNRRSSRRFKEKREGEEEIEEIIEEDKKPKTRRIIRRRVTK